ncbi:MAG TPA: hypothetical protein PLT28_13335, partial [Saprospiraceae bacterium]|nr:hypothetical protein [Saprospiraceae bacterium]
MRFEFRIFPEHSLTNPVNVLCQISFTLFITRKKYFYSFTAIRKLHLRQTLVVTIVAESSRSGYMPQNHSCIF